MRVHNKVLFLFLFYILSALQGSAQRCLGVATGEWNAINSIYLNPANIADCREKLSIGILSFNFGINNNLGTFSKIGEFSVTNTNNFKSSGAKDFSMIIPDVTIHGPGIVYSINKHHSLAITTGFRIINQINNFDQSLYNAITNSGSITNHNYNISSKNFNWTAHMWSEVGITYAAVIRDNEKREVKVGFTIKRLGGIGYVSVTGKNMDINYNADSTSFYASNTDLEFSSNIVNDKAAVFQGINASSIFDRIFGKEGGGGMCADIGVVYKLHLGEADPSDYMESGNTHDIVFSASVTDFGAINYTKSTNADIQVTGNGYLSGGGIKQNSGNISSFTNYANQQGFTLDTLSKNAKVFLPVALLVSADMQISGRIHGNLLYINNLANRMNFGNSYYNQVTFTPRYDWHKMTIGLPITYSMLSKDVKMGIGYRISGFFIGSDDALAFISKNQRGFNMYLGGYIPIFKIRNDPAGIHWSK